MPAPPSISPLKVCHLSVLNPVLHSRIFYKEAITQVTAGYEVTIIAQGQDGKPFEKDGVWLRPFKKFGWLGLRRLWAPLRIFWKAWHENADVYQLHTPELLCMGILLKWTRPGCKLIYDVHEDYYLNLRYGGYWPQWIRRTLAEGTRIIERWGARRMHGIVYAEDCFDLPVTGKVPHAYVLNKYTPPPYEKENGLPPPGDIPVLLFTGTIAENWGVWEALHMWQELNQRLPVALWIAGYAQDGHLIDKIHDFVRKSGFESRFQLIGGKEYVSFATVIQLIGRCTLGLALYRLRVNLRNRIPTRFYEFMAHRKPLLFSQNPPWNALNDQLNFGISVKTGNPQGSPSFSSEQIDEIAAALQKNTGMFYQKSIAPADYAWEGEGAKLLDLMQRVLAPGSQ